MPVPMPLKNVALRAIATRRRYRARGLMRELLSPGGLVFDVGANVGDRVVIFRDADQRVIAIEPQSICADRLDKRFGGDSKVVIERVAVGAEPGEAEMAICTAAPTISTLSDDWKSGRFAGDYEWDATETVQVTTLDALIERHGKPDFCKIDVEGFEQAVLQGLSQPIALVSVEWVKEDIPAAMACASLLDALGDYEYGLVADESFTPIAKWYDLAGLQAAMEAEVEDAWGDVYARLKS